MVRKSASQGPEAGLGLVRGIGQFVSFTYDGSVINYGCCSLPQQSHYFAYLWQISTTEKSLFRFVKYVYNIL